MEIIRFIKPDCFAQRCLALRADRYYAIDGRPWSWAVSISSLGSTPTPTPTPQLILTNVALSKPCTASSQFSDRAPSHCTDGLTDGGNLSYLFTSAGSSSDWVQIDLGQSRQLSKVRLYNEINSASRSSNLILLGANTADMVEAVTIGTTSTVNVGTPYTDMTLTATGQYQFVRIQRAPNQPADYLSFAEIEIYAYV